MTEEILVVVFSMPGTQIATQKTFYSFNYFKQLKCFSIYCNSQGAFYNMGRVQSDS